MWATIDDNFRETIIKYLEMREQLARGDINQATFDTYYSGQFAKKIKSKIPEESDFDFKEFWTNTYLPYDIEKQFNSKEMQDFIVNRNNMTYWIVAVKVFP